MNFIFLTLPFACLFAKREGDYSHLIKWFYNLVPPLFFSLAVVQVLQRMAKKLDTSLKNIEQIRKEAIQEKEQQKNHRVDEPKNEGEEDNDTDSNRKGNKIKTN